VAGHLSGCLGCGRDRLESRVSHPPGVGTNALFGGIPLPLGGFGLLGPQLGLADEELGLRTLLPRVRATLLRLVLLGLLGLRNAGFHLLGHVLHLLVTQGPLDRRQQLLLLVAGVLAEGLLQVGKLAGEGLIVLRQGLELGQRRAKLLVVPHGVRDQVLGLRVLPENREQVLLLETGMELELSLELGEKPLPRFHRAV
jgi:hypothetical protein